MNKTEKIEIKKETKRQNTRAMMSKKKTLFVQVAAKRGTRIQGLPYAQIES